MAGILDILNVVGTVVDRVIPDPKDKLELQEKLAMIADQAEARESAEALAQIQVDSVQAANPSMFVAGARPALMWTGVAALTWEGFMNPFLGLMIKNVPHVDPTSFGIIVSFTAGLCGLRTYNQLKGIAKDSLSVSAGPVAVTPIASPTVVPKKKVLGIKWPF
jgi:hypothetical protein